MKSYINGNYFVMIHERSGTKEYRALRSGEDFKAEFPDSIDLKITDKCSIGCPFCHESSTPQGQEGDFVEIKRVLSQLPEYPIEIALGGGDLLESPTLSISVINWLKKDQKKIVAGTFNIKSLLKVTEGSAQSQVVRNLDNIGVSITRKPTEEELDSLYRVLPIMTNMIYHVILGIIPPKDLKDLLRTASHNCLGILILGYKQFGRGKSMNPLSPELIQEYLNVFSEFGQEKLHIVSMNTRVRRSIGFDNLALEQLNLKNYIHPLIWERIYLGEEFTNTMYVDAVKGEFAPTSRSTERVSWNDIGIIDYFKQNHR